MRILILLALAIAPAMAQDYCSLEVLVIDEQGAPVARVPVNYVESDGDHGTSAHSDRDGLVRFCNLGLSRAHVRVRCADTAMSTRVEDVTPEWQKTVRVAILVPRDCSIVSDYARFPYDGCTVLFRFETEDRKPVANVRIAGITAPVRDRAGRVLWSLDNKQSIRTTASAPGYAPAPVEYTCAGPKTQDQFVILEELP